MSSPIKDVASGAARAGGTVVRQVRSAIHLSAGRRDDSGQPESGWLAVTVYRELSDLEAAGLPAPLAELGDQIQVRLTAAPAGKGTELAARLRDQESSGTAVERLSGEDPDADLRAALREAKQILEVGEVLAVDPVPHGERTATPGGLLLEAWTKVAPKGGVR